ncbi:MAG: hypothetical protein FJ387_26800 [Verrucomicrobia bacterium]|nr:hypothetical protein [Verrucomicrobiota bacterium]
MQPQHEPFDQRRFYLQVIRPTSGHERRWRYSLYGADGNLLLEARFTDYPHGGSFHPPARPGESLLHVRARRGFWWHGRYDVTETVSGARLGELGRNGQIYDASGHQLGCVRNAEPGRRKLLKGLFIGVMDAVTSGEGVTATLPAGSALIEAAGGAAGELRLVEWPFQTPGSAPASTPPQSSRLNRLGRTLAGQRQSGWLLDFSMEDASWLDSRVRLAAAVLHIHSLNRWWS